jgi:hypothetical protein
MSLKRLAVALILYLAASSGCSDKNDVPGGILPRDKMAAVLWDMAEADQYVALYITKDSAHIDRKAETMRLYEEVFRLHQVTRDEFRKSYRYYLDHPAVGQPLFDSTIARGSRVRTEMYDRPGQYHPPVVPPARTVSAVSAVGANPARPGFIPPGVHPSGATIDPARRTQQEMRRRDSVIRAMQKRRDTTKGRP